MGGSRNQPGCEVKMDSRDGFYFFLWLNDL